MEVLHNLTRNGAARLLSDYFRVSHVTVAANAIMFTREKAKKKKGKIII